MYTCVYIYLRTYTYIYIYIYIYIYKTALALRAMHLGPLSFARKRSACVRTCAHACIHARACTFRTYMWVYTIYLYCCICVHTFYKCNTNVCVYGYVHVYSNRLCSSVHAHTHTHTYTYTYTYIHTVDTVKTKKTHILKTYVFVQEWDGFWLLGSLLGPLGQFWGPFGPSWGLFGSFWGAWSL